MQTTTDRITKIPGVCGGNACIRGTRITVWGLEARRKLGLSDKAIMERVQGLTQSDLDAAWEYTAANEQEIDEVIRRNTVSGHPFEWR